MVDAVTLYGYRFSVYNRIVRVVLHEKQVAYDRVEINPFEKTPDWYERLHPFLKVPVLCHGPFTLFETSAITR